MPIYGAVAKRNGRDRRMSIWFRNIAVGVIIILLLLALFSLFQKPEQRAAVQEISFSEFLTHVDQGRVRDVLIQGSEIHGTYKDGRSFQTYAPNGSSLITRLQGQGVGIAARSLRADLPWWLTLALSWVPFIEWSVVYLGIFFIIRSLLGIQRALEKLTEQRVDRA
jgi:ATP-dependent Zn protease